MFSIAILGGSAAWTTTSAWWPHADCLVERSVHSLGRCATMTDAEKNPFTSITYADKVGPPMKDEHFLQDSTDMHKAAALLKHDEVDKLLAGGNTDVDKGDVLDQTPLILLSRNHYDPEDVPAAVSMINKLIAAGATLVVDDKIRRDEYGDSPIHLAAMAAGKNGPTILAALVNALPDDRKAQLCSARCKNFGNTAVREAPHPPPSPASALLPPCSPCRARRIVPHACLSPSLASQLHWATLGGDMDACQVLLDAGCRLDRANRQKETVVDYAVKYERVKLKVKYEALMAK